MKLSFRKSCCGAGVWLQRSTLCNEHTRTWNLTLNRTSFLNVTIGEDGDVAEICARAGDNVDARIELEKFEGGLRDALSRCAQVQKNGLRYCWELRTELQPEYNKLLCDVAPDGIYIVEISEPPGGRTRRTIGKYSEGEANSILAAIGHVREDEKKWRRGEPARADLAGVGPVMF